MVTAQIQYSLANARSYFSDTEELCTRFSKRHVQIDEAYRKLLQDNPALAQVDAPVEELRAYTGSRGYIRSDGQVTTGEVLARERQLVQIARDGSRACSPLVTRPMSTDPRLDREQRSTLQELLTSTDAVAVFRGGAGTGKSFVLRSLVDQVQASVRAVAVLAPQRQQVVEMEKAGFPNVATVAAFLTRRELPPRALVVVDEAGQIGGRQMLDLLQLASERGARVILSGDTRQHGPVEASDALRAIELHGGVKPVALHRIRRQDPDRARDQHERRQIESYRDAVEAAAKGDLAKSFRTLQTMGAVVECGVPEQADRLAQEYVRLVARGASSVVVSQTWSEVHRLNERIREALKRQGLLGAGEQAVEALERVDLTSAQKRDERFYPEGAVVVFNRKVRRAEAGAAGKLAGMLPDGVLVETGGRLVQVPHRHLDRITVCVPREISLAPGDKLHLKANRRLGSGAKVVNGELVTVKAVWEGGGVELEDGRVLWPEFREFLPGYAVTSYGSQGKTVDYVLLSDSGSKAATNAQQWYVSISRGRRGLRIFTPNAGELRESITQTGDRPLAVDLAPGPWPERSRWRRVRGGLQRLGRIAVDRLRALHFFHSNPETKGTHPDHQRTRGLGV